MQEKIDFALITKFKTAVEEHHDNPVHTMWQKHPSLRSLFMGEQVVVFNPNTGEDDLYKLPAKELLLYFQQLLLLSPSSFSSRIVKEMWEANLELRQLFCGRPVPLVNTDTNQEELFKLTFVEILENFKSASHKDPEIALTLLHDNECLRSWLKGERVRFFNSDTQKFTVRQIDGNELLFCFECVLGSRSQKLINFMWTNNEFLFETIKALSFEESLALLIKVMKSSNRGNSLFIQNYLQLITDYGVILKARDEINPRYSITDNNLAALLNARLAQLPIIIAQRSKEQMDLIRIRNFLSTYTLGPKNNIFIETEYHSLLNKYRKKIGIAKLRKVENINNVIYEVTFDMTIFPKFLNKVATPQRAPQQAPQYPAPSSVNQGGINFHETVALKVPSQQQNTMPHPLIPTHPSTIETKIPDSAKSSLSSNFHHPMSGWQGVYKIHKGAMLHQMMPSDVRPSHFYPSIGDPLWNSSTVTTTNTFTANAHLIQEEEFLGQSSVGAPEQQTMHINNVSLAHVSPENNKTSLSSGVSIDSNNRQVQWSTKSSFTPLAQKRTMTSNEFLPVAKKRKTMELNVSGAEQKMIPPIEAPQQSQIHEESPPHEKNYQQYYQGPQFGTAECDVNLESLGEIDESEWNNVFNSPPNDMLSSSMLNHIGFFGVPQSSQETKPAEQKIKDTNRP